MDIIHKIHTYEHTLPEEGLRMRTGIVVDFRQWEELRKEPGEHIIPLLYAQHIREGRVNHNPSGKEFDWIIDEKPSIIQKNKNYVFCKSVSALCSCSKGHIMLQKCRTEMGDRIHVIKRGWYTALFFVKIVEITSVFCA